MINPNDEYIKQAVSVLRKGGVILYPTDTIWGLGCDATNEKAVERIFDIKRRPTSKSLIVLLGDAAKLSLYVDDMPDVAWDLMECASEPLTVIYEKGKNLASNVINDDGSVGIRITDEAVSKMLCNRLGRPLVSTSANISGEPSATIFAQISENIKQAVDYIIPLRQQETHSPPPSQIIKLNNNGVFRVIR